jgi:hypothetical protein
MLSLAKAAPPHAALFHNNHDGTFTDVTQKAGVANDRWGFGCAVADYDNDGWPDLYVTNYGKNRLYHNNHDGTFTDVAEQAGVASEHGQQAQPSATTTAMAGLTCSSPATCSSILPNLSRIRREGLALWSANFVECPCHVRPARAELASRIICSTTMATVPLPT